MVTFELKGMTSDKVVYKYFPENHRESAFGVFSISLVNGDVELEVAAEMDYLRRTSAKKLNEMRDAINEMRKENGEPPLTEEELPIATEDEEWYQYADHAIRRIKKAMEEGNILEKDTVAWY